MCVVAVAVLTPSTAAADDPTCHPRPRRKRPPARPPTRPVAPPAAPCKCDPGPQGPRGPSGPPGRTGDRGGNGAAGAGIPIAVGVMGSAHAPHGDWAWGPAIQLRHDRGDQQLVVDIGLAAGFSGVGGNERGFLAHVGYAQFSGSTGVTVGLHATSIDGSPQNGEIDGTYLGVSAGLVYRRDWLRLEVAPVLSALRDDSRDGTQLAIGLTSSAFAGWSW